MRHFLYIFIFLTSVSIADTGSLIFTTEWNRYDNGIEPEVGILTAPCSATVEMSDTSYCVIWPIMDIISQCVGGELIKTEWNIFTKNGIYDVGILTTSCDGYLEKEGNKYCTVWPWSRIKINNTTSVFNNER